MTDSTKPSDATSYKDTAFGVIPRSILIEKEFEGIGKGLSYILALSVDEPMNDQFLLKLHDVCFGWIFPKWAGTYRTIDVETSTHAFPSHTQVRELTKNFFDDLNERFAHSFDPIALLAWAQHKIVWIHPFQDYNGRIARLFALHLMRRFDLPLVEIKAGAKKDRQAYIAAMKAADRGDLSKLEKLLRDALAEHSS